MENGDDVAVLAEPPEPIGVLVLRAQRTAEGLRVRLTSTFDVERSPQGTARLFTEPQRALACIASWLSSFEPEPPRGSVANTAESTWAGGSDERPP